MMLMNQGKHPGEKLRQGSGPGGAGHSPMKPRHKEIVKADIGQH